MIDPGVVGGVPIYTNLMEIQGFSSMLFTMSIKIPLSNFS